MEYLSIGEQGIPLWDELSQVEVRSSNRSLRWLWLGLAIVVLSVCLVMLYSFRGNKPQEPNPIP